ncbi:hypothetical protein C0L75_03190 [Clostridium perfringens]
MDAITWTLIGLLGINALFSLGTGINSIRKKSEEEILKAKKNFLSCALDVVLIVVTIFTY